MFYVHATFCVLSTACCLMCIGSFLSLYRIRKDYGFLFFAFLNGCSAFLNFVLSIHGAG